ncbi:MAG TPA: glutamate synthase-related protein [Chitinophagaceae bacterium]
MNGSEFHGKDMVVLPRKIKGDELTVLFGNSHCSQPYLSSIICIGSKSADQNVIFRPKQIIQPEDNSYNHDVMQSLKDDLFINDSIWSIESGYAGSIDHNFKFDAESFRINAERPTVKMIQLKLSVFNDQDNISTVNNSYSSAVYNKKNTGANFKHIIKHTAFRNAESMAIFLDSLRQLSGKKPIGIRPCVTDKNKFHEICYAFRKTGIIPDFIVIEAPNEYNSLSKPSQNSVMILYEALLFVSKTLEVYGLGKDIKIIAASEIYSPFDVLRLIALGADAVSFQNHGVSSTVFPGESLEQLRGEILNSTLDIMEILGYTNVRDITLPAFLRDLDTLYREGFYKRYNEESANNSKMTSFKIVKKNCHVKNCNSEIILN